MNAGGNGHVSTITLRSPHSLISHSPHSLPKQSATTMLLHLLLLAAAVVPAAAPPPTIPHDAAALLAFKAAADLDHRLRFPLRIHQCRWPGVRCSNATGGRVVRLVLDGRALRGSLSLQGLEQLRVLSLSRNALAGPLPDLSPLLNLKSLFLSSNDFSGPFPSSLLHLPRLRTLDLSFNNFSGGLPPALAALPRLSALRLHSNRFSGLVPSFNQSTLRSLNLSHNLLSGLVPATATLFRLGAAALAGNPGLCGEVVSKPCPVHIPFFSSGAAAAATPSHPPLPSPAAAAAATAQLQGLVMSPPSGKRHRHAAAIGGFAAGVALVVVLLVGFSLAFKRMHKRRRLPRVSSPTAATSAMLSPPPQPASLHDFAGSGDSRSEKAAAARNAERIEAVKSGTLVFCAGEAPGYTLDQLMRASAEMLGRGTMGTTYKAVMDGHLIVGVKRLDAGIMAGVGREAFDRHMGAVGNLRHPNLVPLRAFFQAKEERLLVYEYQPNGSLHSLIHGSKSSRAKPLHWTSCLKIAEDVAQGLAYIHQASRLVHGNIKSSNVLLGADFEACLTDYCLTLLVEPPDDTDTAYRAPETRKFGRKASPKSDVYSFGVLLLELITGRPPLHQPFMNAADLPTWVRSVREDEETEESRLLMLLDIAVACTQPSEEQRPTTWQILKMVQEIKEVQIADEIGASGFI